MSNDIISIFEKTNALKKGHFELSSGLHSAQYLQCALVLQHPEHAKLLADKLAEKLKHKKPTCVIAPAIGGIVISYVLAEALGVKSLFTERIDGKMQLRRGFSLSKEDQVIAVEDVITTGGSLREAIEVVKAEGAELVGVATIINRSKEELDFGAELSYLLKLDVPTFEVNDCPLCKDGVPIDKPGSR